MLPVTRPNPQGAAILFFNIKARATNATVCVSTDSLLLGTEHQGFFDELLTDVFREFSELAPRDRKIIIEMIKFLKQHPK